MQIPLQVTFRGMESSAALNEHIREETDKLEQFFDRITRCHVVVDQPHRHHSQGRHFRILVDLTVPGAELVVGRDPRDHAEHEEPYAAVSEAFSALRRQLQEYVRRRRREVKHHEAPVL